MKQRHRLNENINKQALTEGLLYLLVWTCVFLVPILNALIIRSEPFNWNTIKIAWGVVLPYFLLFLVHNFCIAPRLLITKRYLWYTLVCGGTVLVLFTAVSIYQNAIGIDPNDGIDKVIKLENRLSLTNMSLPLNLMLGIFMCGLNAGVKMIFKSLRDEQIMESLKRNMLQAELDYLKYQINPHFFMNTLNNIHALIDIDTEAAKDTVIELSKMMRYVLYDSEQDYISLEKEINFLNHYIRLMRLRYSSDKVEISIDTPESVSGEVKIPPLIFIVFVENAFKHGVSYNSYSYIRISISVADGRVNCRVVNSKNPNRWNTQGGIGLDNVRKRLDLLFPQRYKMTIDETDDSYGVALEIPIQ